MRLYFCCSAKKMPTPPRQGRGWLPDLPDFQDLAFGDDGPDEIAQMHDWLRESARGRGNRPRRVDLRQLFEDSHWNVYDQGPFNTSSVFAVLDLVEYFERIVRDRELAGSHAFVYCTAQKLAGSHGDSGVSIRDCFKALRRFGLPPDRYWPYDEQHVRGQPLDPFSFSFAREYADLYYMRVGQPNRSGKKTLRAIRQTLSAGFAVACGFPTPNRLPDDGDVPYRPDLHDVAAGQAVTLLGYDDRRRIGAEVGALLFRNSWGPSWGDAGYGWLPYAYVRERLARDFWTLMKRSWIEAGLATRRIGCPDFLED